MYYKIRGLIDLSILVYKEVSEIKYSKIITSIVVVMRTFVYRHLFYHSAV